PVSLHDALPIYNDSHAIGLGQMNLHGYLARERIYYGSEEGIDFTNIYFYTVLFHALAESNKIAIERGSAFKGFADSTYASGGYFDKYTEQDRKSTRLNSSHVSISYAVFCLNK